MSESKGNPFVAWFLAHKDANRKVLRMLGHPERPRVNIEPLSDESRERIDRVREAHARGENTALISAEAMSREEIAAQLRRLGHTPPAPAEEPGGSP